MVYIFMNLPPSDLAKVLDSLALEATHHRAVHHPYLQQLSQGTVADLRGALADFARQYSGYTAYFSRYVTCVAGRLTDPSHRQALLDNLQEESGCYSDHELDLLARVGIHREWIDRVPHPQLFARFARALDGVADPREPVAQPVAHWRTQLLALLTQGNLAQAVGALSFGTEHIVSTFYPYLIQATERLGMPPDVTVFFKLHTLMDDAHQHTLRHIAQDFAGTPEGCHDLRQGMRKALMLRCAFWDWMYERMVNPFLTEHPL